MNPFPKAKYPIPSITTEQMIEVDRLMIEDYHIELIQMMENAGRGLALLASKRFLFNTEKANVLVLAGTGGNGGGAMVAARRLAGWGHSITLVVTDSTRMTTIPKHQLGILTNMGIFESKLNEMDHHSFDLIVDGIIGYSISGNPKGAAKEMIEYANQSEAPVLALDTPSGIDLTSGTVHEPTAVADATLTLALPKKGLFNEAVIPKRGELYLADISVPRSLYIQLSISIQVLDMFKESDIIRIN